nr:MAG TPA: hypothetical protein [Caudoviricetes sp.]
MLAVESAHIARKGFALSRGSSVAGIAQLIDTAHIDDVAAHSVVAGRTIGALPGIDAGVFVVLHETLYTPVEVHHVSVAHLPPAPTRRRGRGVPAANFGRTHLTPLGGGSTMDDEIF